MKLKKWCIVFVSSLILIISMYGTIIEMVKQVGWSVPANFIIILIVSSMNGMIPPVAPDIFVNMFGSIVSTFGYILLVIFTTYFYHHVVEDLGVAVRKLCELQMALHRLDPLMCSEQCIYWLTSVDDLQRTEQDIKVGYARCDLNYLRKKARQELNRANDLLRHGDNLLHPQDHLQGTMNFYMKKVIGFIKTMGEDSSGLLGICGMGGVGKSSLLKLVSDSRSEYDYDFVKVMLVRAGIGCTVSQVQEAIATSMGLSLECDEASQAKIIHDHLKDRSFLLLLDDLWGYLDLKAVGIPSPLGTVLLSLQGGVVQPKWRKVVLTSRNMDLCGNMGCHHDNTIQMEFLDEEDVWELYRTGWPIDINRVDKSREILSVQTPSSSTDKQLGTTEPYTINAVQLKRPQDDLLPGMMQTYRKVHYFIEFMGAQPVLLGVSGTRGVGKTALLRFVRDSYIGNSCFDHIIFVGAGTGSVVNNVQHAIAINLGLDLNAMSLLDELSRATHIFNYLKHKNFLLLLDDIREPLNWWAVGLPLLSHRRQKIILVTRTWATCALMGCSPSNTIEMLCLGNDDAWNLFKCKVGLGIIDNHPQVHHLAKQTVSRCGGLPLALCALGRAMSNKEDPREWRSAHSQLMAIHLKPCEIDDKAVTSILNPLYVSIPGYR